MSKEVFLTEFKELIKRSLNSTSHKFLNTANKGEVALMIYIYSNENVTPGELINVLNVGSGRIANALKNLEKKGNIIRVKDKFDKRKTFIYLTNKGKEIVSINLKKSKENIISIYKLLGDEDALNLIRIMRKLVDAKEKNNV